MYAAIGIVGRLFQISEHHAGGTDRAGNCAGFHNAISDRAGRLVSRSRNHWRTLTQTGCAGGLLGYLSTDLAGFAGSRESCGIEMERLDHFVRPFAMQDVEESCAARV